MIRMFVRHSVADYATWRREYDAFDDVRTSYGVRDAGVFRDADDGNRVTAFHDFDSLEAAQSFAGSDALREAMGKAGVTSAPEIWYTQPA